ncbi:MAG: toprim domain-containing protein, partial [Oscillospiraceae bacterium]|nr:toprim domain-containing protein [Oscillospiraceae bacterium]
EVLSNAVDEAREGYGDVINIRVFRDHSIEVEDFGRGVPLGYNEREKRYNWDLIYCELYAGGKYNNSDSGSYQFSLGTNGLGACATQYSSEHFEVWSYDGENCSNIRFKKGKVASKLEVTPIQGKKRTGTVQRWRPDLDVFTDIATPREYYQDILKRQAVVNAGIKFNFYWETAEGEFEHEEFLYARGVMDRIDELSMGQSLTQPISWQFEATGRDREDKPEYRLKAQAAFCCCTAATAIEYYHNSSYLSHGGSPDKATRSAFVSSVDKYLKAKGLYKKGESKVTFGDIEDCMIFITNSFSTETSYENQTKKSITNKFIADAMTDFLKRNLDIYFTENPVEAEKFAGQVLINKRSRESSEATRLDIKKKLTGNIDISNRVEKFISCRSKDPELRELFIVEGDSAKTSCKHGRNAEFQAVIPVRGKTLNCMKSTYDKIFKNEIITDLLKVIGCGVEISGKVKGNVASFDYDSLRWNKIIICTDADEDGFQIRTLLLTMFYRLLPTLLERGRVYIAESPLYEIVTKDGSLYAFDEREKVEILAGLEGQKYTLLRSKGLAQNNADMMWETTMNPATRRLIKIMPTEAQATVEMFDTLLGDNIVARRDFIAEHGSRYIAEADV